MTLNLQQIEEALDAGKLELRSAAGWQKATRRGITTKQGVGEVHIPITLANGARSSINEMDVFFEQASMRIVS